jgi:CubicO group peptidase (beta-lactamase class C family)
MYSKYLFLFIILAACKSTHPNPPLASGMYFPPITGNSWADTSVQNLGWNTGEISTLIDYLDSSNSKAFIVLKDGKIVLEEYFGQALNGNAFSSNSLWYWASAGKTITSFLVGKAQEEGFLSINDPSSDYLGAGWSNMTTSQEDAIRIHNHLTMTTGLNYLVSDLNCTADTCLNFKASPGTQWFYHNAAYTLLENIVTNATGVSYNQYTDSKIENYVGMSGQWVSQGYNKVYWSKARDMARFGLLMLNNGVWKTDTLLHDKDYLQQQITSTQSLNPSYGYLWWLNDQSSIIYPGLSYSFNHSLIPNGPSDLYAALGMNGQIIDVVPSKGLVIIRMGEAASGTNSAIQMHVDMWDIINTIIP